MGMTHSTSGKWGYGYRIGVDGPVPFQRQSIEAMLAMETRLRLSERFQKRYSEKDDVAHFAEVTREIQLEVLRSFGTTERDLPFYQTLRHRYQDDLDLWRDVLYHKYDFAKQGHLRRDDAVPNCLLYSLKDGEVQLHDYIKSFSAANERPLVIIAGSAT